MTKSRLGKVCRLVLLGASGLHALVFSWIGETGDASVFYYRIHSPVILIEFDHQTPVGTRHLSSNPRTPDRALTGSDHNKAFFLYGLSAKQA